MANLYSGYVTFEGFKKVSDLTNITFTNGTTYEIQIQTALNDKIFVREGTTGKGFIVNEKFKYIAGDDDLYVGGLGSYKVKDVYINIAS